MESRVAPVSSWNYLSACGPHNTNLREGVSVSWKYEQPGLPRDQDQGEKGDRDTGGGGERQRMKSTLE